MSELQPPQRTVTAALNAALAQAQGEFPPIPKDKTVTVRTRTGDGYRFSYATLDAILAACRPALTKHGLAIMQQLEHNGQPCIRTELRHADGGVVGASFPLPQMPESPQQLGSLITYLRRYAITALLGIAAEEDDDGEQAAEPMHETDLSDAPQDSPPASEAQAKNIWRLLNKIDKQEDKPSKEWLREVMGSNYGTEDPRELTKTQAIKVITDLKELAGED